MSIETSHDKSVAYVRYPAGEHDSIQYHFFCEELLFSVKIFRTESLERHCVWLYDGATVKELVNSSKTILQGPVNFLQVTSSALALTAEPDKGSISVYGNAEPVIEIKFQINSSFTYLPTRQTEPVTHLPDLTCTVVYQSRKMIGTGYCKRYFGSYPATWEYRFIHCVSPSFTLWSADALFGSNQYCYFHLLPQEGPRISSLNEDSSVSDSSAQALVANQHYEVRFKRIASFRIHLRSDVMDSLLQQHYCHATLHCRNQIVTSLCLNETCAGTLG